MFSKSIVMDVTLLLNEIKLYVDNMKDIIIDQQDIKKYDYMPYITCSILMKMIQPNMNNNDTFRVKKMKSFYCSIMGAEKFII